MTKEAPMRELFIEELAEVTGGNPLDKVWWWIRENLIMETTLACGEEGPC
jgi:hypothetical protein